MDTDHALIVLINAIWDILQSGNITMKLSMYITDYGYALSKVYQITHWMPLPEPPKKGEIE